MKAELQQYLSATFGAGDISHDYALGGQVHIRFELGGELPNGTQQRVEQASQRAATIFRETFTNSDAELWVLIYEYQDESFYGATRDYLEQQFPAAVYARFYNQLEMVDTGNEAGEAVDPDNAELAKDQIRLIIGKVRQKDIAVENILRGIANLEMGFKPALEERIFFIDPQTNRIFYMYDDRGCIVGSNAADTIRPLYQQHNEWIVDYHRPEIDKYFR
ncbi:DUF3885 domain-containing protein [Hymenobacter lucidus]|uniref:DUF3885 domain-containing protein n=1 Tax=Hymenobacter lucidus TaxID=2880930 RepID=A0ABS8APL8_9BACT|nr:DUF3885 domain-containing protein [Hymenobacter lucidus]MCB2408145.1 DUF3885 domain-containing protein [Hymenobacter lucidus]